MLSFKGPYSTGIIPGMSIVLNHGTLRGVGAGLSMPRTSGREYYPQTVNSYKELEAFQPLPRDFFFPGIFSTNAGPALMYMSSAEGKEEAASRSRQWRWQLELKLKLNSGCRKEGVFEEGFVKRFREEGFAERISG